MMKDLDDQMWNPDYQIPIEFRNLEPIWRKLNKAELDYVAMQRESRLLSEENKSLRNGLRMYLDEAGLEGEDLSRTGLMVARKETFGEMGEGTEPFR